MSQIHQRHLTGSHRLTSNTISSEDPTKKNAGSVPILTSANNPNSVCARLLRASLDRRWRIRRLCPRENKFEAAQGLCSYLLENLRAIAFLVSIHEDVTEVFGSSTVVKIYSIAVFYVSSRGHLGPLKM